MRGDRRIRLLLAAVVLVALVLFAGALLAVADTVLSILQRLQDGPAAVYYGFLALLATGGALAAWLLWWLLAPVRRRPARAAAPEQPPDEASLRAQLETERAAGGDVAAIERELAELARRREGGRLFIAMFGDASAGKSSLVQALVPESRPETAVTAGTTRDVRHYEWHLSSGDVVSLADVPGSGDEAALGEAALAEAVRAHLVIYVCEGDLSRSQHDDVATLAALGKPLVVAVNKADWYAEDDLQRIVARLAERLSALDPPPAVVPVVAGGLERVLQADETGREIEVERPRAPRVEMLREALQERLDDDPAALDALRDASVFRLAAVRLEDAATRRRREQAAKVVSDYTKKAVVGALAAVSPGTDVLIQGYLGTSLVKALCRLYGVPAREIDIQRFLDIAQGYVGRAVPLVLAISGNVLKAFPGAGTVAGGLVHAVAYGIIFDAMGKGLAHSLETTGDLRPAAAAREVGDQFGQDIGKKARQLARLALEARRERRD
jgi:GTP-binding protein EngB required for normal cell division